MESKNISLSWAVFCFVFALSILSSVKGECNSNGAMLTDSSGNFTSPNYPSNYPNSTTCRWIISVPEGQVVKLSFETFMLEDCCACDHVLLRDGRDENSPELGEFCGDERPAVTLSSGRYMWIEFLSDSDIEKQGFSANYTAVEAGQCSSSGITLSGAFGSFTSPNYPYNYPNSKTCRWIISVPEGQIVELTFETFLLETCISPSICSCDHVQVRDGKDQLSPELGEFCGKNTPAPIRSTGRFMWIEFATDFSDNNKGFRATYAAHENSTEGFTPITHAQGVISGGHWLNVIGASGRLLLLPPSTGTIWTLLQCKSSGISLTGSSGSLTSPNYPRNYPNSNTCRWIITVPEGHRVKLTFQTFLLETCIVPSICTCDHVEVRDGKDGDSSKLEKYCGSKTPDPIYSTGRFMWIEFKSDFRTTDTGFRATYIAEEKASHFSVSIGGIAGIVVGGIIFVIFVVVCCYQFITHGCFLSFEC